MVNSRIKGLVGIFAAGSLFVSSTGAVAATSATPVQQINPWAALAVMSGAAPVAALCNGQTPVDPNAAPPVGAPLCVMPVVDVTQGPPQPTPIPPVEPAGGGLGIDPLLLVLAAVVVGVGLYFLLRHHHHSNSPA
jgi:hypothetical protein